jgi:hypothetical protein
MSQAVETQARAKRPRAILRANSPDIDTAVQCGVTYNGDDLEHHDAFISGPREFRDKRLQAALDQHLKESARYRAISERLQAIQEEEQHANGDGFAAEHKVQELLRSLRPFAVTYKGLLFGVDGLFGVTPAMPILHLVDSGESPAGEPQAASA